MGITPIQRDICRLLAEGRKASGESYVAGGVALNELLRAPRRSRDIDVFHDSESALAASWARDRDLLGQNGFTVEILREAPSFVEALASRQGDRVLMQWARDSTFRFFPLVTDDVMGLALHPFDLATNKVLAMAGRLEPRDWVDTLSCDERVQPLGYLVWAACGKDPGFNPRSLLEAVARAHVSQVEMDALDFDGAVPDAGRLARQWHEALETARAQCAALPVGMLGRCVVTAGNELFRGGADELRTALQNNRLRFHEGRLGGAWPEFRA